MSWQSICTSASQTGRESDSLSSVPSARQDASPAPETIGSQPTSCFVRAFQKGNIQGLDLDHGATGDTLEITIEASR